MCVCVGGNSADLDIKLTEGGTSARAEVVSMPLRKGQRKGQESLCGNQEHCPLWFSSIPLNRIFSVGACKGSHSQYQALWDIEPVTPMMMSMCPAVPMLQ